MKKLLLSMVCAAAAVTASAGTFTYSHTFANGEVKTDAATYALSGVDWQTTAADYVGFDSQNGRGLQLGSAKKPATTWSLSTAAFKDVTISKVALETVTASGGKATVAVTVNGAAFGTEASFEATLTTCTFTGSAKGDLAITFTNGSTKAMYIKSLTVTYEADAAIGGGSGSGETPVDPVDPVDPDKNTVLLDATFEGASSISAVPGWKTVDVKGDRPWATKSFSGNTYAYCSAYKGTSTDGYESWLISPAIDLSKAEDAVLTFESQRAYISTDSVTVYVLSTDDPATASLTQLDATWARSPESGYSNWVKSGDLSLSSFGKKTVYIGFCYMAPSGLSQYCTICVDNVKVAGKGEGGSVTPNPVDPVETVGDGSKEKPYTVADIIALNSPGTKAWSKGYIVGYIKGKSYTDIEFAASDSVMTNIVLAAVATETDPAKCIPVQLPAGAVRDALNLKENPGNLGKEIMLYGSLEKYFGQAGIRSVTEYALNGDTPVDPNPVDPADTVGKGTEESPYTVGDIFLLNNPGTKAWSKGYIVGYIKGKSYTDIEFAASDSVMTNIVLAAVATETDPAKCIPVQLPAGEIRSALNLKENPGNLGKEVALYGSLEKYFGQAGIKSVSDYKIEGAVAPTYPEVETIADFLDEQPETFTTITSPVAVVYQNGLDLFVQDETGSMLVYGNLNDRTFTNGDRLTGLTGKFNVYHGMVQCQPVVSNFPEAVAGAAVEPAKATLADVNVANLAKYVTISGLTATSETTVDGDKTRTVVTVSDDADSTPVEIYNRYGIEGVEAATEVTVTGFVYIYDDKMEIVPVEFKGNKVGINEVTADAPAADVIFDLQGRRVVAPAHGLYIINGRKVLVK